MCLNNRRVGGIVNVLDGPTQNGRKNNYGWVAHKFCYIFSTNTIVLLISVCILALSLVNNLFTSMHVYIGLVLDSFRISLITSNQSHYKKAAIVTTKSLEMRSYKPTSVLETDFGFRNSSDGSIWNFQVVARLLFPRFRLVMSTKCSLMHELGPTNTHWSILLSNLLVCMSVSFVRAADSGVLSFRGPKRTWTWRGQQMIKWLSSLLVLSNLGQFYNSAVLALLSWYTCLYTSLSSWSSRIYVVGYSTDWLPDS